jgi:hypothetical protein
LSVVVAFFGVPEETALSANLIRSPASYTFHFQPFRSVCIFDLRPNLPRCLYRRFRLFTAVTTLSHADVSRSLKDPVNLCKIRDPARRGVCACYQLDIS